MKKLFAFIIFLIVLAHTAYAQNSTIDSLKQLLFVEKSDTGKILILAELASAYWYSKPDSAMMLSKEGLTLSRELKYEKGEALCLKNISIIFRLTGNYPKAFEIVLQALKKYEILNDKEGIANCYRGIANIYGDEGDIKQELVYDFIAKAIAESIKNDIILLRSLINLGDDYEKLNQLDSARIYTQQAYELAVRLNFKDKGMTLVNLGNIHSKMKQSDIAMGYYRLSLPDLIKVNDDESRCEATLGLAKLFEIAGQYDSALYYARLSLSIAEKGGFTHRVLNASSYLAYYYKSLRQVDSAYHYQEITIAAKDTLYSQEKTMEVQNLGFTEQLRQQEISAVQEQARKERKQNIQYALIALGIITFIILFLLLSRSFITSTKLIEFLGVMALLIVFEFLNLLLHPFLERVTNHTPVLMLLGLVCVAAILVPLHYRIEKWSTAKLIEKNKKIRLANAKKTIEQLEEKTEK
ncbi:MAG TPA: tetratricopeptide repeat protein [Ignavibacteria bacterium]